MMATIILYPYSNLFANTYNIQQHNFNYNLRIMYI